MADTSTVRASREDRRLHLLEAADRVITRDGPAASMQAIAAEAGITKPILYRHFGDKGGLLRALAEHHTDVLLAELRVALAAPGNLRARTSSTIEAYLRAIEERPEVYRFLTRGPGREEPEVTWTVDVFARRLGDELATGISVELRFGPDEQTRALSWGHGIVGLVRAAADVWLERRHVPRDKLRDQLVALLWGEFSH
ncbi:MAG: TetR family transcriptional regulator [Actinomycetes bacterium]